MAKTNQEIMEILEAFDLTRSYRAAAQLTGTDHKTVAHYVERRKAGFDSYRRARRSRLIESFAGKVEEWVDHSHGRVRADVAFDRLVGMGFTGAERTVRRAVAEAKERYRNGHRRTYRPWIPEPGMWLQYDWGWGPVISFRQTFLFCAWLAWSRYRVIIPTWDRTLGTVLTCLDNTLRRLGGAPTYLLTDHVARHIIGLLCPNELCGRRGREVPSRTRQRPRVGESGHITIRAGQVSSGGICPTSRLAWCGIPPKHSKARYLRVDPGSSDVLDCLRLDEAAPTRTTSSLAGLAEVACSQGRLDYVSGFSHVRWIPASPRRPATAPAT